MMVESLLDVLLQTLLSIMSKSHSVETSRGQRCPQCTAEITVSFHSTCLSEAMITKLQTLVIIFSRLTYLFLCFHICSFLCRGSMFPAFFLSSDRWQRSTFITFLTVSTARRNWRWESLKAWWCLCSVLSFNSEQTSEKVLLSFVYCILGFSRLFLHLFLQEFLLKIFCVFRNLMKLTIFPRDWSVMRLLTSQ